MGGVERQYSPTTNANFFSSYKNTFVLKLPIGNNAGSYGIMFLGNEVNSANVVKHEYGHKVQWENKGIINFTLDVAIPSVTINILGRMERLPYDYYSYPWEAAANKLGDASLTESWKPALPKGGYSSYWDLVALFF